MKKKDITSLGDVLKTWYLHNTSIQDGLRDRKAIKIFMELIKPFEKQIKDVSCKNNILIVSVYSSSVRTHFQKNKKSIMKHINNILGNSYIEDFQCK